MGRFTLHNGCASCSMGYLKSLLEFKSRLLIPEFSGYHCISCLIRKKIHFKNIIMHHTCHSINSLEIRFLIYLRTELNNYLVFGCTKRQGKVKDCLNLLFYFWFILSAAGWNKMVTIVFNKITVSFWVKNHKIYVLCYRYKE